MEVFVKLYTKYFGEIEYLEEDLLHFTAGPFGFEGEREIGRAHV